MLKFLKPFTLRDKPKFLCPYHSLQHLLFYTSLVPNSNQLRVLLLLIHLCLRKPYWAQAYPGKKIETLTPFPTDKKGALLRYSSEPAIRSKHLNPQPDRLSVSFVHSEEKSEGFHCQTLKSNTDTFAEAGL